MSDKNLANENPDKKGAEKKSVFELGDAKGKTTLPTTEIEKDKVAKPTPPASADKKKDKKKDKKEDKKEGKADKKLKDVLAKTETELSGAVGAPDKGITKEDVVDDVIAETAIAQEPSVSDYALDIAVVAEVTILDTPPTDSENPEPTIESKIESIVLVVEPPKPIEKSAQQIAYENEVEKFNSHIENTCKFWYTHCLYLSHQEKHSITSLCTAQGINVTFTDAGGGNTKVLFTKGKTSFSFLSKTIFW